jgi:hypothetical protein
MLRLEKSGRRAAERLNPEPKFGAHPARDNSARYVDDMDKNAGHDTES